MNSFDAVKSEINTLTKIIVATVPVEQIYLFGSFAYGTPHKDSDLDLYVVFKDDMTIREIDALISARIAMAPVQNMPLDLLGLKRTQFLDRSTVVSTIEKEVATKGVKIYG